MLFLQHTDVALYKEGLTHPHEREHQALYRAYSFGPFRLLRGGEPVGEQMWRRSKAKTLLKWFLLNPGKLCSADEFIDLFWPNVSPETSLGNLHVTMHYLRHLLEPSLNSREVSKFIQRRPNNFYCFHMDDIWWSDTTAVQKLFETARELDRHGDCIKASFYYRKVVGYCSLGFLSEDIAEEWLTPYRQGYKHIYSQVLIRLIQIYLQRNELDEALEYAYQALTLDPYCEPAVKAIIDVHLQQGNTIKATCTFDAFRNFLRRELGVGLSKEFHNLRKKIIVACGENYPLEM